LGPEQVIRYLSRYTHRVGVSNQRLVSMDERGVTFRTKEGKTITRSGCEMLARFVQHVLPPHFVKIRHYGLHASSNAKTRLERARLSLVAAAATPERVASTEELSDWRDLLLRLSGLDVRQCPACLQHALVRIAQPDARCRAPPEAA
jgi:hypothetical protein